MQGNPELLGVDGQKGIIYAQMEGAGRMQLELRGLQKQNIKGFAFAWPRDVMKTLVSFSNEQYNVQLIDSLRPTIYKAMLFLEIPQQYFAIHDNCLVYVKSLIAMEQYNEAFYLLSRINLNKLDGFGYRDFSEAALDLVGKMIRANPQSAKLARALLQRITIRDNSADHASYLKLADSLRSQGLYNEAISEYARLGPIVNKSVGSPYAKIIEIWPIYCYLKLYEMYAKAAVKMLLRINKISMLLCRQLKIGRNLFLNNEYYYKYTALTCYAKQQSGNNLKQNFTESFWKLQQMQIKLDLPESLMMAGDAYEKLKLTKLAENVYKQVTKFYEGSKWAAESQKRLDALPPS